MPPFHIVLNVKPTPKARPRMMRSGVVFTPKVTASAEAEIRWLLHQAQAPRFEGPVFMQLKAFFLRPKSCPKKRLFPAVRPDLDNVVKLVKDACNTILFHDDAQICQVTAFKLYGDPERIELLVGEMTDLSEVSHAL
jgi:Holliday junction resolvase RusA-like endonuclease